MKRVRCVNQYGRALKNGKIYEVLDDIGNEDGYYQLKDDSGNKMCFFKHRFEEIKEDKEMITEAWCDKCGKTKCDCERLYTTGQMIDKLLEDNSLIASYLQSDGYRLKLKIAEDGFLCYENSENLFTVDKRDSHRTWRITKPEPQKVSFVEAFKAYLKGETIVSNREIFYGTKTANALEVEHADDKEIDGEWIILD